MMLSVKLQKHYSRTICSSLILKEVYLKFEIQSIESISVRIQTKEQ